MITDKEICNYEKTYLDKVIDEIKLQLEFSTNAASRNKKEAIELQKEMWEEVRCAPTSLFDLEDATQIWQYQTAISNQANRYKFSRNQVYRLERMYREPYFGRVDFLEDGEKKPEQIYIGIHNLASKDTMEFLVYDWRAPISGIFYDFEIGLCSYECPEGIITGEMVLKRQYKIRNSKIVYMFDSSLNINDDILREILGKSTDNRMQTIVTSIQREQNSVIRNIQDRILVVEGPAGSGKTSIALHRAAYLLYKYRESISSENILVFSPNHIFEDYISSVLPELGEENVQRSTFADFFVNMLDSEYQIEGINQQMEYILSDYSDEVRLHSIKFKSSIEFLEVLKEYVKHVNDEINTGFHDLVYEGNVVITSDDIIELFNNKYSELPYIKRLEKLRRRLYYLLEQYENKRVIESNDHCDDNSSVEKEKAQIGQKSNIEYAQLQHEIMQMTTYDIYTLYKNLFKEIKAFVQVIDEQKLETLVNIGLHTIEQMEQGIINYEDIAPIIFLKLKLGAAIDAKFVKHVIIDEAQDYTAVQYEIFKEVFKHCNMTILGDVNQSINEYMNVGNFNTIVDVFDKKAKSILLTRSYRSSKEIFDFCKEILMPAGSPEQLERHGNKPKFIKVRESDKFSRIINDILELKNRNYKLIAVICKTTAQCEETYKAINTHIDVSIVSNRKEEYRDQVVIIPSYLAKGLEFDAVLVNSIDNKDFTGEEDRKLVYTICTRALHELYLYYYNNISDLVSDIGQDVYELIN